MREDMRTYFNDAPIDENNLSKRLPIVLCLDTSPSMNENNRIESLNVVFEKFIDVMRNDTLTRNSVEIAIVTFSTDITIKHDFNDLSYFQTNGIPKFQAELIGSTELGKGILKSLELIQLRREKYLAAKISSYVPYLIVVTDGDPNKNSPDVHIAIDKVVQAHQETNKYKQIFTIPIGVGNDFNPEHLEKLSQGFTNQAILLTDQDITDGILTTYFKLISESITSSVTNKDDVNAQKQRMAEAFEKMHNKHRRK
jgi:uncharacterized protein YegL